MVHKLLEINWCHSYGNAQQFVHIPDWTGNQCSGDGVELVKCDLVFVSY
jgi:hypothetical protein